MERRFYINNLTAAVANCMVVASHIRVVMRGPVFIAIHFLSQAMLYEPI
jgi:hypothetical protein